jgi:hypothetical protein
MQTILSFEASLHVTSDATATESLVFFNNSTPTEFPSTNARIPLREAYRLVACREHVNQMNNWGPNVFDTVWWKAFGMAIDKFNNNNQLMLQKYFQNRLPTNRRENRYYKYITPGCHCCNETETQEHLLRCTASNSWSTAQAQYITNIKNYLQQLFMSPETYHIIINSFQT